jgi:phage major head subunit gpT-like protein
MTIVILAAAFTLVATILAALTRREPQTNAHPDLPGLADVLTLAKRERGWLGLRWGRKLLSLRLAGIPLMAGGPMISDNWAALLTPGLKRVFTQRQHPRAELFKRAKIFNIDTSLRAFEDFQAIGGLSTEAWNEFERTGRVPYDAISKGWLTRLEHREFAKGIQVRRKLMDDNLYPGAPIPKSITGQVVELKDSALLFQEKSAADVFNNGFTDSGTDSAGYSVAGADGVGLFSTAHPVIPNGTTVANEGTRALTSDNVVATKNDMRAFVDAEGELTVAHPDTLLVPPELEETARRIVESPLDPDSANNAINVNKDRYEIVVWDYLTDANAWFMLDSTLANEHLIWLDRKEPEFNQEYDNDTHIGKWGAYMRFSRGWDSPFFAYGNNPG